MHVSTNQTKLQRAISVKMEIFTRKREWETKKNGWLSATNQKTIMSSKRTFSKHFSNGSWFWQFRRHAGAYALAHSHTRSKHKHVSKQTNFFGMSTREKTHVPFIMTFTNFSINRLMFFVLSSFSFLDTSTFSLSHSVVVYTNEMCVSVLFFTCPVCVMRYCCDAVCFLQLDISPVSSFSSKR